ncbi:sugar transferase [Vibrio toranzoniae]|nr:sugar transferase [Vibrio toranzoniae]
MLINSECDLTMYFNFFKRIFDFIASLFGFVFLSPLFLLLTIYLYFVNNGKPFFFQERPGKNEKKFKIIKFKTMNDKVDFEGDLLPMGDRITPIGAFMRKASLDEIPQLINVIKGDMSLIGPRPLLVEYLPMYTKKQQKRHAVRPGVTGWAQVNGRNFVTLKDKLAMDVWYVENASLKLDFVILLKTIKKIIIRSDVAHVEAKITKDDFIE